MKKNDKNIVRIFRKTISSNNFFALILCVIIGVVMLGRTLYINQKLSANTETVTAEIIDLYWANKGQRLWGYEMKYKFYLHGNEFVRNTGIQKNERERLHIGDCIEIVVSVDDNNVQKWNKSKGTFKCQ